jgi:hypothetical protein
LGPTCGLHFVDNKDWKHAYKFNIFYIWKKCFVCDENTKSRIYI